MVSAQYFELDSEQPYVGQIVMQPNNSMSWRSTQYFLMTLVGVSLSIAAAFMWQGYWVILPFTVLELSILSACLYYILKRNQTLEVVRFSADEVVIQVGRKRAEHTLVWQRFFTKIMVHPPKYPWYPNRIALRCRDKETEIGRFLSAADKRTLISEIRQMIAVADNSQTSLAR